MRVDRFALTICGLASWKLLVWVNGMLGTHTGVSDFSGIGLFGRLSMIYSVKRLELAFKRVSGRA